MSGDENHTGSADHPMGSPPAPVAEVDANGDEALAVEEVLAFFDGREPFGFLPDRIEEAIRAELGQALGEDRDAPTRAKDDHG